MYNLVLLLAIQAVLSQISQLPRSAVPDHIINNTFSDLQVPMKNSYKYTNILCQYSVRQTEIGETTRQTVKEILGLGPCENFEIVLLDPEHYEDISISLSIPIFIRGRYTSGEEDQTIWRVNSDEKHLIYMDQGDLTLSNINFQQNLIDNIQQPIQSQLQFIYINGNLNNHPSLTVQHCNFRGYGVNRQKLYGMVYSNQSNKISISDCTFSNAYFIENAIRGSDCDSFSVKRCIFTDLLGDFGPGILIDNQRNSNINVEIIENTFKRCSQGYQDGLSSCITLVYNTAEINLQNNKFWNYENKWIGNAQDVYIRNMGIDIITDDEQYYKQILEGSLSILQNSVYYDLFYGYFSLEQDTNPGFKLIYVKFPREEEFDGSINEVLGDGIITTELQVNLIGLKHLEKVSIDQEKGYKRGYISIKGDGEQNQQRVILGGGAEDEGEGQFVITISEGTIGDILIWNIEMQKWLGGFIKADGGKSISLRDCLFYGGGTVIHNTIGRLEATKCEFMGKGAFVDIDSFIITSQGYIDISESIFHHGSFLGQEKGCIVCNEQSTYCLIWSSYFVDNKLGSESAAVLITTQTCKQLSIKGTADLYGEFSGMNQIIEGHFIRSVSKNNYILFAEFSDAIFTQNGNTVLLEGQISQINLLNCNFKNLQITNEGQKSSCIHSLFLNSNELKFFAISCLFSDCSYSGLEQAVGNVITVEQYDGGINHYADNQVKFENCFFTNNKGFGFGGTIALNIKSKCLFIFKNNFFNQNRGSKANDIWIQTSNDETELRENNFSSTYSISNEPHIVIQWENFTQRILNLNNQYFILHYVSNQITSSTEVGSRDNPYKSIINGINDIYKVQSNPLQLEQTIILLDKQWNESLEINENNAMLSIRSEYESENGQVIPKTIWSTSSSNLIALFYLNSLKLERFIFIDNHPSQGKQLMHFSGSQQSSFTIISCEFKRGSDISTSGYRSVLITSSNSIHKVSFIDCLFSDILIKEKLFEISTGYSADILINRCNFTNIDIIDYISASTLCFDFYFANIIKINISNNSFEKCISHEVEERGILIHIDEEQFKANSLVIIENNIFRENVGQKTGGIFFQLMSRAFYYSFANNSFYKNLIVGESFSELGQGKGAEDAYIQWYYFPDGWTADNIKQKITDIFQGSTTYQYSQTVYYEVLKRIIDQDYDEMILYGYIDLLNNEENQSEQELDQKDSSESDQNPSSGKGVGIGIIIAIAIGALIVVAAIIVIIIVIIVCLKVLLFYSYLLYFILSCSKEKESRV